VSWYPKATKRPIPEATSQPNITPRGVVLHTAVSNSKSLFGFWTSPSSDGVESHFYLQKEGTAEQYVGTETRADCQVDGNPYCISVEAWDGAGVIWTRDADIPGWNSAQVAWLVDFLVWAHREHGIPLRLMRFMGDSGIGYHRQFVGPRPSFATKPRECPGDRKVRQIPGIIALANKKLAGTTPTPPEDDMTPEQANQLAAVAREVSGLRAENELRHREYESVIGKMNVFNARELSRDADQNVVLANAAAVATAAKNAADAAVLAADRAAAAARDACNTVMEAINERFPAAKPPQT
jgi:hypothetical protein